jgi:hypothetical protein
MISDIFLVGGGNNNEGKIPLAIGNDLLAIHLGMNSDSRIDGKAFATVKTGIAVEYDLADLLTVYHVSMRAFLCLTAFHALTNLAQPLGFSVGGAVCLTHGLPITKSVAARRDYGGALSTADTAPYNNTVGGTAVLDNDALAVVRAAVPFALEKVDYLAGAKRNASRYYKK